MTHANKLLSEEKYLEVLSFIDEFIIMENIDTRIIKGKALLGIKEYDAVSSNLDGLVDAENPNEKDFEILNILSVAYEELINEGRFNYKLRKSRTEYLKNIISNKPNFEYIDQLRSKKIEILSNVMNGKNLNIHEYYELAKLYFIEYDLVKASIYYSIYSHKMNELTTNNQHLDDELSELISTFYNFGEIYDLFLNMKSSAPFIFVVDDESRLIEYKSIAIVLKKNNLESIMIYLYKDKSNLDSLKKSGCIKDTMYIDEHGLNSYDFINCDNQFTLLDFLYALSNENDGFIYVFCEEHILDSLKSNKVSRKNLHYLVNTRYHNNQISQFAFGYIGDYLKYLETLYKMDIKEKLKVPQKYKFSIIIPVRNNIYTLKKTLATCLEVDYENYEIVISDNSDSDIVKDYIKSISSDKINYYKTPIDLHLTKSFEFAYLMSQGEFLIPIGADEGILKTSLKTLEKYLERYPKHDIFSWGTLSYNWPETIVKSDADKIVIGNMFSKHDKDDSTVIKSIDKLIRVINKEDPILTMPTIYQRSGMRRNFLSKLLDETGGIMYGISQDIFMGVQTLLATSEYVYINKPVVVIGNSNYSIGAETLSASLSSDELKKQEKKMLVSQKANAPIRCLNKTIPIVSRGFTVHFYICLYNLADRELVKKEVIDMINWKNVLKDILSQLSPIAVNYEKNRSKVLRFAESMIPDEVERLKEEFPLDYNNIHELYKEFINMPVVKNYEVGVRKNKSLALDGSKFGVCNIYDAVKLIENLLSID